MYFRFLFQLFYSGLFFVILFPLIVLIPAYLAKLFEKSSLSPYVTFLSNAIFLYLLCLWPAFCVTLAESFGNIPYIGSAWIYYTTASLFAVIGAFISIERGLKVPPNDSDLSIQEHLARRLDIAKQKSFFYKFCFASFIIFLVWSKLASFLYGWLLSKGL
jgi:hypothetical protein